MIDDLCYTFESDTEFQYAFACEKHVIRLKYDNHVPTEWLGIKMRGLLYYEVHTDAAMMESLPKIKDELNKALKGKFVGYIVFRVQ